MSGETDQSLGNTRPAGDHSRVRFTAPSAPFQRANCLRIRLPGLDEASAAVERPVVAPIVEAVGAIFDANAGIDLLELLSFPGPDQQEYLVHGTPTGVEHTAQTTLDQAGGRSVPGTIATRLDEHLPGAYGLERVDLRLQTVGIVPLPTCRLVLPADRTVTPVSHLQFTPVIRMLRALHAQAAPHLYQVLLRQHGEYEYTVSVRLVVFQENPHIETDAELAARIQREHPYDLADIFHPAGLSSNFQLPMEEYVRVLNTSSYSTLDPAVIPKANPERRRRRYDTGEALIDLYRGHDEYRALMQGRDCYDEAYAEALGYPKFTVTPGQLGNVIGILPAAIDQPVWETVAHDPPAYSTESLITEAAGTAQAYGEDSEPAPTLDANTVPNTGSATHQSLLAFAAQWLHEQGYEVEELDQDTTSLPDLRARKDGTTHAVEIESANRSKAANLLANVARAVARDRPVIVITESKKDAAWAAARLKQPFKRTTPQATQLYNWTAPVRLSAEAAGETADDTESEVGGNAGADEDDRIPDRLPHPNADPGGESATIPLLPSGVAQAAWWLMPDGTLELTTPDRETTLAQGPAGDSTGRFDYATPRYSVVEDAHTVFTEDGDVLTDYATKSALTDDWTLIRQPHVPMQLSYLRHVRIRYQAGRALERFQPTPDWDLDKSSVRYSKSLSTFLETYTVEREGAELEKESFRQRWLAWYRQLTNREAPGRMWFGRAMPDDVATKARQDEHGKQRFLADRTWRYPEEIVSPDLPGVETASDGRTADRES